MGWNQVVLQQIRNQILGQPDGPFGDLNEVIYMQQIIQALLGQPQVGPYGNLDRRVYLQRIRDVLTNVLATYPKNQVLATGQLTSYGSGTGVDDGAQRRGTPKSYLPALTTGQYAGTVNILINGKTDVHSNNCIIDLRTGLMWNRSLSGSVGPASNGLLPWTTTGAGATAEGIFPYLAAANAALLSGYSDWRVPNALELISLADSETPGGYPDATAFPVWPNANVWTNTTAPVTTTNAIALVSSIGRQGEAAKTTTGAVILVRSG